MAAQDDARAAGNAPITPAHPVLGLLSEPGGIGAQVIEGGGVSADRMRQTALVTLPEAVGDVPELIPFDAQTQKALQLAFRQALRLGHDYIGTEHVLLALLEAEDGTSVLSGLGIDAARAEADVVARSAEMAAQQGD